MPSDNSRRSILSVFVFIQNQIVKIVFKTTIFSRQFKRAYDHTKLKPNILIKREDTSPAMGNCVSGIETDIWNRNHVTVNVFPALWIFQAWETISKGRLGCIFSLPSPPSFHQKGYKDAASWCDTDSLLAGPRARLGGPESPLHSKVSPNGRVWHDLSSHTVFVLSRQS